MTALVATVGGSAAPIVSALQARDWSRVVFVCTEDIPKTGQKGSLGMVAGIVRDAGAERIERRVVIAPPDDLDAIYETIRAAVADLRAHAPGRAVVIDYTGGTKSMSAAAVLVALESPGAELQLMTKPVRANLVRVIAGERATAAPSSLIQLRRAIDLSAEHWRTHQYDAAAEGFRTLSADAKAISGAPDDLVKALKSAATLSTAFGDWDRFHYQRANNANALTHGARRHAELAPYAEAWADLRAKATLAPRVIFDLYNNALRRASQGRFDDAVARLYRLLEWTAQWLLKKRLGLDTSAVPPDALPETLRRRAPLKDGGHELGLAHAWELVSERLGDAACARFYAQPGDRERTGAENMCGRSHGHISKRNQSFLAHGKNPVSKASWRDMKKWLASDVLPAVAEDARRLGQPDASPQLPTALPARLARRLGL